MSSVWISRDSWNKVWSALHNIRVRQSHTVKTASAMISGAGTSARLNIDLPAVAGGGGGGSGEYTGMFAVLPDPEQKNAVKVNSGIYVRLGEFHPVAESDSISIPVNSSCYILLIVSYSSRKYAFQYRLFDVSNDSITNSKPIAYIKCSESGKIETITQLQYGVFTLEGVL